MADEVVVDITVDDILGHYEEDMFEDWKDRMLDDITKEELKLIESIFRRASEANPTYYEGEEVEIDCQ